MVLDHQALIPLVSYLYALIPLVGYLYTQIPLVENWRMRKKDLNETLLWMNKLKFYNS